MERILIPLGWNLAFAAALALIVWLLGTIPALRRRPTFLYALWLLVLAKLIVPPFIGLPLLSPLSVPAVERHFIPPPTIVAMPIEQPPAAIAVPAAPPSYHWTDYFYEPRFWLSTLTLASLLITAILWLRTFLQARRWHKLLNNPLPTPVHLQNLARTAAASLRIQCIPDIILIDARLTPFLWTSPGKITRAKNISIVLPRELTEKLTDDQLLCILMHELGHYARGDHWVHAFAGFVTSLFWWNPVSWWAWRELRALQEICCDTLVLKYAPDSRRLYAETLYSVLESLQTRTSAQPALSCSFGDSRHLRRRFSMLADTKIQPRLSPFALLTLLALTPLLPCLPTRAEPPATETTTPDSQSTATETTDPATAPATRDPKRYTIRMSIYMKSGKDGKPVIVAPSNSDTKLAASEITLHIPALTVEAGQEATASTKLPEVMSSGFPYEKKSVVVPHLSITTKPLTTPDGKISLDLKYKVETERAILKNQPPESPFIIDPDLPKKVVLLGPQNDPNLLLEVTVTEADLQPLQYMIEGTFHYQDPKSTDAQHSIESVKGVTRDGISATFGLNKLALPEFNLPGSFYGMALSPRSIDQQGKQIAFTSELTAFSLNPRTHKTLEKYPEFFVESGKPAKLIFRADENGKPILWFDFTAETISLDAHEKALIAPPGYTPTPASAAQQAVSPDSITQAAATIDQPTSTTYVHMYVQSHPLPERFWIRPGEHLSQMRSPTRKDFQPILDHITKNFAPDSWSEKGGPAQYELLLLNHSLVVFSTPEVHNQIATYLDTLRPEPPNQKGKYTLSLGLSLTGPGLFGVAAQSLNHSSIVAHNLITPTGQDPLGRPIATRDDYEKFIASLKKIEPKSWDSNGGQGRIEYSLLTGTIHFQNTSEVSSQIHNHCAELLQKNLAESPLKPGPLPPQPQPIQPVSNEVPATPSLFVDPQSSNAEFREVTYKISYSPAILKLLKPDADPSKNPLTEEDLNRLAKMFVASLDPQSWKTFGGHGTITPLLDPTHGPCLVVRHSDKIHTQISATLQHVKVGLDSPGMLLKSTSATRPATHTPSSLTP